MFQESTKGCIERKCPCGMWVNCNNYKIIEIKKWKKRHGEEFLMSIHEWYDTNFRRKFEIPADIIPNG